MPVPEEITSTANPRVKRLVRLRKPRVRREEGLLIAEGRREVQRAIRAGLVLRELWRSLKLEAGGAGDVLEYWEKRAGDGGQAAANPVSAAAAAPAPTSPAGVVHTTPAVFRKIAYHRDPEGILGLFEAPEHRLNALNLPRGRLLVAVGTEKPGNLGAMVRTAAAAGCDAVLAVGTAVDIFNPNTIRNSTGAVFELPVVVVEQDADAIGWLRSRGVRVAAALAADGPSCFTADLMASAQRPLAVVIGPEHAGLGSVWRDAASTALTIPSQAGSVVDSLNASAAAAVLLFEVVRQSHRASARP